MVLTADKEIETVIMNRVDYASKMLDILNDPAQFVKLARNCLLKSGREFVAHLSYFKKKDRLSDKMYRCLLSSDDKTPKIYCLSKAHKTNCPLRPTVFFIGYPT